MDDERPAHLHRHWMPETRGSRHHLPVDPHCLRTDQHLLNNKRIQEMLYLQRHGLF